jgi:hypothetical protein
VLLHELDDAVVREAEDILVRAVFDDLVATLTTTTTTTATTTTATAESPEPAEPVYVGVPGTPALSHQNPASRRTQRRWARSPPQHP